MQALRALLDDDKKFGFIVLDGNGALFATLSGNTREVLHKLSVDLPKKHGKIYCNLRSPDYETSVDLWSDTIAMV